MSRPITNEDNRGARDSDAIEVYAPAPPSVEPPPGERSERAGTYSMSRKSKEAAPSDVPMREHTGRIAVPVQAANAAARPRTDRESTRMAAASSPPPGAGDSATIRTNAVPPQTMPEPRRTPRDAVPQAVPEPRRTPSGGARSPHVTAPIASKPPSGPTGVVMTRPAVIVGAPPKVTQPQPAQRVRKAREDEGRGFGQGLISEKSLDEVILAYLSEDAEDK
jgi:hypothetical protein